jgi:hypothetical protein
VTASSPSNKDYSGTETHTWEIIPWVIYTNSTNSMTFYAENWTATGQGKNASQTWTVNAKGTAPGYLQFWLPPNSSLLNIKRWSTQQTDYNGTSGGNTTTISELAFPGPVSGSPPAFENIVATAGVIDSVKSSSPVMLTDGGSILANEPSDGVNIWTCQWNFKYQPLHLSPISSGLLVKPPPLGR